MQLLSAKLWKGTLQSQSSDKRTSAPTSHCKALHSSPWLRLLRLHFPPNSAPSYTHTQPAPTHTPRERERCACTRTRARGRTRVKTSSKAVEYIRYSCEQCEVCDEACGLGIDTVQQARVRKGSERQALGICRVGSTPTFERGGVPLLHGP